ncbi:phosphatidylglycerol lysyltransferase domain-containing protein [Parabacteroides sp. OttesenSCG-928-G07]|nr:phosphatidylglycerol lysyltransferase domain-containing protein [Parabacteroides sp. OttesenSCG-928-G21]MDL2278591.1 phosphatidylglycerol lysyltransferase domain-containing protein [Parabacteroides sp. OttesenSCG-928-G07]
MRIPFKPISLQDKEIITSFTYPSELRNCDFSFANMCSWRFLYDSEYAVINDSLLIRFKIEDKSRIAYMMPVGNGDLKAALELIEADSLEHGHPLLMLGITPDAKMMLEEVLPGQFHYIPERDYFDYVYLREDLSILRGKKYQSKRNHINTFKKKYRFEYMPITPELVPECLELERKWYKANRTEEDKEELSFERRSITYALEHFNELGLSGGAICVEHQIVAFSFGMPINHNTFGVHIEKADIKYDGVYAVINQEFTSHLSEQYVYVNREEDLGIPGLRQAKLSYQPVILLEKNVAVKKTHKEEKDGQQRANQTVMENLL